MSSLQLQPNDEPAIQDALQWLQANSIKSCASATPQDHHTFIPEDAISTHFDYQCLKTIVEALRTGLGRDDCNKLAGDILKFKYLRVFCILLCIDKAQHIRSLLKYDLSDARFPVTQEPDDFPQGVSWTAFRKQQWRYFAYKLVQGMEKSISRDRVLPIVSRKPIGEGDETIVYKIELHPEYDGIHDESSDPTGHLSHTYALKVYNGLEAQEHYQAEIAAFSKIQAGGTPIDNLLLYHGAYVYEHAYHVILEYADVGTLEDYFQKMTPPTDGADILAFWQATFGLAEALDRVHRASGWHQDVNPKNILIRSTPSVSQYAYSHKLADWGRSHFKDPNTSVEVAKDVDTYGTKEYACVWSEVAVWIVQGYTGLLEYRQQRRDATANLRLDADACFHNGTKMLPCVRNMHVALRHSGKMSRQDYLTDKTWETLIQKMLRCPGPERLSSREVLQDSANILDMARTRLNVATSSRQSVVGGNRQGQFDLTIRTDNQPRGGLFDSEGPEPYLTHTPREMTLASFDDQAPSIQQDANRGGRESASSRAGRHMMRSQTDLVSRARPAGREVDVHPEDAMIPNAGPSLTRSRTEVKTHAGPAETHHGHNPWTRQPTHELPQRSTTWAALRAANPRETDQNGPSNSKKNARPDSGIASPNAGNVSRTQRRNTRESVPRLSFVEVSNWVSKLVTNPNAKLPYSDGLKYKLKDRDHHFLVDDSSTMRAFYEELCGVFRLLARIVEDEDPDGVELSYTISPKSFTDTSSASLHENLSKHRFGGQANVENRLETILKRYNGVWGDGNPEVPIMGMVRTLVDMKLPRKQVGIQFISFGENRAGLQHLRVIDEITAKKNMNWGLDIVDTEPSQGNIWKMLLGAIDEAFDDDDDDTACNEPDA
ncbi:hypothetical protein LTR27_007570 [Elasticomyces elasticus]|nr:hypothetical protein LTR27_007570 [Elasticomyces elasticus]